MLDRATRLGVDACASLYVQNMDEMDKVVDMVYEMQPVVMVVDSLQTMRMSGLPASPGSPSQVRAAAAGRGKAGQPTAFARLRRHL